MTATPTTSVVGVVLAGGASRRMGRDKATLEVGGVALATLVADALVAGGCRSVELQGGDGAKLAPLGVSWYADSSPGSGPVAAIADVLARHDRGDRCDVVVAACDLPDLDATAVAALIAAGGAADGPAVATVQGRHQLVLFVPAGGANRWHAAIAGGAVSFRAAVAAVDAVPVEVDGDAVRNVNTPDDL